MRWTVPGSSPIAGTYDGRDEVLAYFARRRAIARRSFRMHTHEVLTGDGEHVAALTDGTALLGGAERRWSTVGLYRFRNDLLVACRLLPFDADAFDRIWSAGPDP